MNIDNKYNPVITDNNADVIFKYGNYTNTYLIIESSGIPDGVIIKLIDENSNQLYSPFDVDKNFIKTECSIIIGESDAIPLPAQYTTSTQWNDFAPGTYNWKLKFYGNNYYFAQEIPITVEIRDFGTWQVLNSQIYPNEDIKVKLKTYIDTLYQIPDNTSIQIGTNQPITITQYVNNFLTTNATYDNSTGTITYPNSDILDLTTGQHTQIINQGYQLTYTIKNPFIITGLPSVSTTYKNSDRYGFVLQTYQKNCSETSYPSVKINNNTISSFNGGIAASAMVYGAGRGYYLNKSTFTPGTYTFEMNGRYSGNGLYYSAFHTFTVETTDCELSLMLDGLNFISKYIYNTTTPIPNARIGLINTTTNALIDIKTTDSDGKCIWDVNAGTYKAVALDYDDTYLLESNTLTVPEIVLITDKNIIQKDENITVAAKIFNDNRANQEIIFQSDVLEDIVVSNSGTYVLGEYFVLDFSNLPIQTSEDDFLQIGDNTNNVKFYSPNENVIKAIYSTGSTTWYSKDDIFFFDNNNFYCATASSHPTDISSIDKTQWILSGNVNSIPVSAYFYKKVNTDSNGVATTLYTGKGNGVVGITAKLGETISNEIEIADYIFHLKGDTDTSNWNLGTNATATYTEEGTHFKYIDTTGAQIFINLYRNSSIHSFDGAKDLVFEFDFKNSNASVVYLVDNGGSRRLVNSSTVLNTWRHWVITWNPTTKQVHFVIDDTTFEPVDFSSYNMTTMGFQIADWQRDIDCWIKEFKVYNG